MRRFHIMTFTLALMLGIGPCISARTVAQDDEAKKAEAAAYRAFYDANNAKEYAKALPLAKSYLAQYPSGQYAKYLNDWLASLLILQVQMTAAAQEKNRPEMMRLVKLILAAKDLTEQLRIDYLWFMTADLIQNEVFANPPNFSHASEVADYGQQLVRAFETDKKPSSAKPEEWKPKSVVAYVYTALASIETNNKNVDKSLEYYQKALAADPKSAAAAMGCGRIHYDRYGAAAKAFQAFPEAEQAAAAENKPGERS